MAEPRLRALSIVASVHQVVSFGAQIVAILWRRWRYEAKQREILLGSRYGRLVVFVVTKFLTDTAIRYDRVERDVLNGSAEDALAFKQAITDECNMTAITVSVSRDLNLGTVYV